MMLLGDFDFALPATSIAQHPITPRDAARLLVVGDGSSHRHVRDLPDLLCPGDLLVLNDTKVLPTRITGQRDAVKIEATLHQPVSGDAWRAFVRPARRLKVGQDVLFADDFRATVEDKADGGEVVLRFDRGGAALIAALERYGAMPLPPYIKRAVPDQRDLADYQTVFAARPGAVAAPTAGLHFTPELLARLDAAGIERTMVTLHVGAGTFLPVKTDRIEAHAMHAEWGEIGEAAANAIGRARREGRRVVAVGTTALRLLESAAQTGGIGPFSGETRLFITPGYRFRAVDLLMTNFHLPKSTLFILVAAFSGLARMQAAYAEAIAAGYRFYSYGDACLLDRADDA
jgi:S-adenosylmethionine:tRNA ribosyltransferase-isomerase